MLEGVLEGLGVEVAAVVEEVVGVEMVGAFGWTMGWLGLMQGMRMTEVRPLTHMGSKWDGMCH
jgi:hypothetical protein